LNDRARSSNSSPRTDLGPGRVVAGLDGLRDAHQPFEGTDPTTDLMQADRDAAEEPEGDGDEEGALELGEGLEDRVVSHRETDPESRVLEMTAQEDGPDHGDLVAVGRLEHEAGP
jgi:hypothetical protein